MKLKKIASLALAGVMAVSMLAGCKYGEGSSSSSSSSSEVTTTASKAPEYANYILSGEAKNIMSFKSDATLDAALKAAAENKSKLSSADIESIYDTNNVGTSKIGAVKTEVENELGYFYVSNFKSDSTTNGPESIVAVYSVSGLRSEEEAVKSVVNKWNDATSTAVNSTNYPSVISSASHKFVYEASISALKVASADHPSESAWVVAIVATRTAEDAL